jgi:Stage II sporulation protein E (SpoIIE)
MNLETRRHIVGGALELVGFARPRADEAVCGDAFGWSVEPERTTLVVADGLGHGSAAREAAQRAVESVLEEPRLAPDQLLRRCHAALGRTRGAAVAIVQIDTARMRVAFCGVGNVRIWEAPARGGRGTSIPGIVGLRLPSLRVFESTLHMGDILLFHTDGVPSGFDAKHLRDVPFEDVAENVTRQHGLSHDDATVVALRARATA